MSLRKKTLLIIGLIFLGAALLLTYSFKKILLESFIELEENDAVVDLKRSVNFLNVTVRNLDATNSDWAGWDDTYEFARNRNPDYIQSNLVDGTFSTLRLNLMMFIDNSGKIFWGSGYDPVDDAITPIPGDLQAFFSSHPALTKHPGPGSSKKGLIMPKGGPMILSSRPIVTSNGKGPIRGTLIIGRYLSAREILRMAETLELQISMIPADAGKQTAGLDPGIIGKQDFLIRPAGIAVLDAFTLIRDIDGRAGLILRLTKPRTIFLSGKKALEKIAFWIMSFSLVFIVFLILLLDKVVLSRLSDLNSQVKNIIATKDVSQRLALKGKDEISHLAISVNGMLTAIEDAHGIIRESEEKYRKLFETSPEVIFLISTSDKIITSLNPAFEETTKWSKEDWIGKPFFECVYFEDLALAQHHFDLVMQGKTTSPFEIRVRSGEGVLLTGEFMAAPEIRAGQITGIVGFARDITERKKIENELKRSTERLKYLSNQLMNSHEKERERVSRELHDQVGQDLMVLKFGIRNIMKNVDHDDSRLIRRFREVMSLIDTIIENVRNMSKDLSPSILSDLGLEAALEKLIDNFSKHGNYECDVDIERIDPCIPAEKWINVYRIFQELLTNIAKHAKATELTIKALVSHGHVNIEISDNGVGFDPANIAGENDVHSGMGLSTIRQRVSMLGGDLFVESLINKGTVTTIVIPVERESEA